MSINMAINILNIFGVAWVMLTYWRIQKLSKRLTPVLVIAKEDFTSALILLIGITLINSIITAMEYYTL